MTWCFMFILLTLNIFHSKLTIKAPERGHWRRFVAFIVIFEHTSHYVLVFLLLTLKMQLPAEL